MRNTTRATLLMILTAFACQAATLYDNTTSDTGFSGFFSTGMTQIGDRIQLTSSGELTSLDTQFYNLGSDATFDAVLKFYGLGSPVGSQIGGSFSVTGISIAANTSQTITFAGLAGLVVPANFIVAFSVENVSQGGDIGLNFFDPPTVGASNNTFFIADEGSGFVEASTLLDVDNLYVAIEGTPITAVPEPAAGALVFGGLAVLGCFRRSRTQRSGPGSN